MEYPNISRSRSAISDLSYLDKKSHSVTLGYESFQFWTCKNENLEGVRLKHKRISHMTYQSKSIGKMADSETLTLCIKFKFKSNVYLFLQGPGCRVLPVPGNRYPFSN